MFGRSDITNTIGCQYFDTIILGNGGSNVHDAKRRRRNLDYKMLHMSPEHVVKEDNIKFENKVIFNKRHATVYNNMFKGIKDYKIRRIVRIVVSYILYGIAIVSYGIAIVSLCKLYNLVKQYKSLHFLY